MNPLLNSTTNWISQVRSQVFFWLIHKIMKMRGTVECCCLIYIRLVKGITELQKTSNMNYVYDILFNIVLLYYYYLIVRYK